MLAPFLFVVPLALAGTGWRAWQWWRGDLPAGKACRWMRCGVTACHVVVAGWLLWMAASCIWPGQCGESFGAGFAAGAVALFSALWAALWLLGEVLLLLCRKPASPPLPDR